LLDIAGRRYDSRMPRLSDAALMAVDAVPSGRGLIVEPRVAEVDASWCYLYFLSYAVSHDVPVCGINLV
jgi:hypothetical protein